MDKQKQGHMNLHSEMLERLVRGLCEIYGDLVLSIILYGSAARGSNTDESDIDIAVLIKDGQTREMYDSMSSLVVDLQLEYDKVLSVLRIDYNKFKQWENVMPFYVNVKKDGIVLWKAA